MTSSKLLRERLHHHPATAAERRILIVAKQDAHRDVSATD
jgi:hypothetical protein